MKLEMKREPITRSLSTLTLWRHFGSKLSVEAVILILFKDIVLFFYQIQNILWSALIQDTSLAILHVVILFFSDVLTTIGFLFSPTASALTPHIQLIAKSDHC